VFERHLAASELVELPVDLVVWPENAIDAAARLEETSKWPVLTDLADRLDAVLLVGVTEDISDTAFVNSQVAISPDGESLDRYEKRIRVPFGEFVPFRSIIEPFAPDYLPQRDAAEGQTDAVLATPAGDLGVAISWEIFFDRQTRLAVHDGAQILVNPTNGSSYWLTIVQTQQVASSRLRALETDRYVLQASPTGFTAIVTPDGEVLDRTGVSEQAVVHGTVELREGKTWAVVLGPWPMLSLALVGLAAAEWLRRRRRPLTAPR
jgi:apolipoprotein N-acyltransferase